MTEQQDSNGVKVAVIGAGVLGSAIAKNMAKNGYQVHATRRRPEKAKDLENFGITVSNDNKGAVSEAEVVFFALKPYNVIPAARELSEVMDGKLCISMAAGLDLDLLTSVFPQVKWVRAMTNTCVAVQKGFTVYCPCKLVQDPEAKLVESLFATMGEVEKVEERFMNPLTAISGSGPAYFYTVIEALTFGGLKVGIPRDLACRAAAHTAVGAAELLLERGLHPAELRDQVLTPGGTTIEGIYELEVSQIRANFMNAVTAATKRGNQLAEIVREQAWKQLEEDNEK